MGSEMLAKIISASLYGIDALRVEVEVDIASGLPQLATVGLAEGAVRESKDRIRAALKNCGYSFPAKKITINLAPADVKKEGSGYDLPMAVGILAAEGLVKKDRLQEYFMVGELSLDGEIKSVRGALPVAVAAKAEGLRGLILPATNASEAAVVQEVEVLGAQRRGGVVDDRWRHDQRHPEQLLKSRVSVMSGPPLERVAFGEPLPVIRRHDHRGVLEEASLLQILQERAQPPVRRADGRSVVDPPKGVVVHVHVMDIEKQPVAGSSVHGLDHRVRDRGPGSQGADLRAIARARLFPRTDLGPLGSVCSHSQHSDAVLSLQCIIARPGTPPAAKKGALAVLCSCPTSAAGGISEPA